MGPLQPLTRLQEDSDEVQEYTSEDAKLETKKNLDKLLEEYYNLDYEDLVPILL